MRRWGVFHLIFTSVLNKLERSSKTIKVFWILTLWRQVTFWLVRNVVITRRCECWQCCIFTYSDEYFFCTHITERWIKMKMIWHTCRCENLMLIVGRKSGAHLVDSNKLVFYIAVFLLPCRVVYLVDRYDERFMQIVASRNPFYHFISSLRKTYNLRDVGNVACRHRRFD